MFMTTSTATATAQNGHYTLTVGDETIEFNDKRAFEYVVIGRAPEGHTAGWRRWRVWAKTNQPRGAEQKWTVWGRRQVGGKEVEVLVVPVEHQR
jgi:hypothetical protein